MSDTTLLRDIAAIAEQERRLVFPHFDANSAWALGQLLHDVATARDHAVVIDIRRFQLPLFFCARPGTTPDNSEWVRRKNNVVARFLRSSYAVGLHLQQQHSSLQEKQGLALADFAPHGGAFPLTVAGAGVVGSITVSGLPQRQDHELVVEALCRHLELDYAALQLP